MFDFNKSSKSVCVYIFVLFAMIISNHVNSAQQEQKLIASNGAADDLFGKSVSISGDFAVVGIDHVELDNSVSGAAYVYEYDGTDWIERAILTPPDNSENYGLSVSISGDKIIVGAPNATINGQQFTGAVYIYHRDINGDWNFIEKETASDHAFNDRFGTSVAIDGNQFIVSATQNDDVVNGSGSVYVFNYANNSWNESQILLASDPLLNDHFGTKIQIENNRLVIAAPDADDSIVGANTGKAYVFENNGASWSEIKILNAGTDMAVGDRFGNDISLSGNRVVVGASENSDDGTRSGSAYVFEYNQATVSWSPGQKLTAFDAAANDKFGSSVSISGDKMLIGSPQSDNGDADTGSVYSYYNDGNSWVYLELITHTDTPSLKTDNFGNAIDLEGKRSIIGSFKDDADGTGGFFHDSGAAYIFDHDIAPVAVNDTSSSMNEDSGTIFIRVLENDTDVDGGTKVIESYTQSTNGTVGQSGPSLSYQPNTNYCNDGNTKDEFRYTLNGGSEATVSITVTCINDLPFAEDDFINIAEDDNTTIIDVLANDDPDGGGDVLLIDSISNASHGTVNFTSTQVTYKPDADYCNKSSTLDYFSYTLTNGTTADVAVRVSCINDKPSFQVLGDINANQGLLTNVTEYSQVGFANNLVFGPNNETSQGVQRFNVSKSDSSGIINTIDILNNGTLQIDFTLVQGVAIVEVSLQDNGGDSDGGIDTSDTLTFNVTFSDTMFNDGFEDTVASKATTQLIPYFSLKKNAIYDNNSHSVFYQNHMFELQEGISYQKSIELINMWFQEVDFQMN